MEIIQKEYYIPSKTGVADVYARCIFPSEGLKAVFQIVHGMSEHGGRYAEFAEYLCGKGFAVFIDDHAGHGKSIKSDDDLGYFGEENGWDALVRDERTATETIKKEFPGLPIIFFGHSMGSFIAREYFRRYGGDKSVAAYAFCGTSGKNPAAPIAAALASCIARIKGPRYRSAVVTRLVFGPYNKKTEKRTPFDWISTDVKQVDKYIADKRCGFGFTAAGYRDLFTLLRKISGGDWYDETRDDAPVLLVSGGDDPVGGYGAGVKRVYNRLKSSGKKDVVLKLYPGMRHEVLNEVGRFTVYEYIALWALSKLK